MKYNYFIVYRYINENNICGMGRLDIQFKKKIKSDTDLKEIEEYIQEHFPNFTKVMIVNWKRY